MVGDGRKSFFVSVLLLWNDYRISCVLVDGGGFGASGVASTTASWVKDRLEADRMGDMENHIQADVGAGSIMSGTIWSERIL